MATTINPQPTTTQISNYSPVNCLKSACSNLCATIQNLFTKAMQLIQDAWKTICDCFANRTVTVTITDEIVDTEGNLAVITEEIAATPLNSPLPAASLNNDQAGQ